MDRWVEFVVNLNRLTQEGKISWSLKDPPETLLRATNEEIPIFYCASYKGQTLGIYEERGMDYSGEVDRFVWSSRIVLGLFDDRWRKTWELGGSAALSAVNDLFRSVQRQSSGIDAFIDAIRQEDE